MRLYSYWRSSCSWRVRIGLNLKNVPHEIVPVHLVKDGGEQHRSEFTEMSPLAQVPVWEWESEGATHTLSQSMAILKYLDSTHPEPRLFPEDPLVEARVWQLAELVNSGIQPLQNLSISLILKDRGVDARDFGRLVIERGFKALEKLASQTAGTYSVGDSVTAADLLLVPQMYNARRFEVDLSGFPTLVRIDQTCAVLESFRNAHPSKQPDAQNQ